MLDLRDFDQLENPVITGLAEQIRLSALCRSQLLQEGSSARARDRRDNRLMVAPGTREKQTDSIMSDRKALTSDIGGGARFQIGDTDEDRTVPTIPSKGSSGSKPAFLSQWMNRLGGATKRRGSVGFNENNLADLPPSRFDDDSRSNSFIDGPDSRDGFSNSLVPRKRNESFTEYGMTPGDDSDAYLLRNKFR